MILLTYPIATPQTANWTERLQKLLVAHKSQEADGLLEPAIIENGKRFGGATEVEAFIKKLEADVADWRTPRCGV